MVSQIGESVMHIIMSHHVTVCSRTVPFMIQTVEAVCVYIQESKIVCHLSSMHATTRG